MQVVPHASGGAVVRDLVLRLDSLSGPRLVLSVLPGCRRPGRQVAALLLGDVGFGAMDRLHVLPERAGVCVSLGAAGDLTYVRFLQKRKKCTDDGQLNQLISLIVENVEAYFCFIL